MELDKEINDLLEAAKSVPFQPYVFKNQDTKDVIAFFKEDADYSEVLTDNIVLYRSMKTGEIVGCKLLDVLS